MYRAYVPGEVSVGKISDHRSVVTRTIRAQITSVDSPNGYVVLTYDGLPSGGKYATVEPLWMSFPSNGKSSWGRYMPQASDMVKVSFDLDDTPRITGYDVIASKADVANGDVGWPALNDQYQKCAAGENDDRPQFANFVPLEPGEYDFMSSGGAYIHGSTLGRLYMQGGPVSLALIKDELKMQSRAQNFTSVAGNSELKFGQVRRPLAGQDVKLPTDTNGAYQELNVALKNDLPIATLKIGDVAGDAALELSQQGQPIRYLLDTYQDNSVRSLRHTIDKLGNLQIDATTAQLIAAFNTFDFNAGTSCTISSPLIKLGGSSAVHPLLLTNVYGPAEQAMVTGLASATQALATSSTALAVGIAAFCTAAAPLMPTIAVQLAALGVVATAHAAAATAAGASATAVATTFNNAYSTYLSTITKTS